MKPSIICLVVRLLASILIVGARSEWIGRKCCEYALDNECRKVCLQSKSMDILRLHCVENLETDLYECIVRHQKKKRCCGRSSNMTTVCQHACVTSFSSESELSDENLRSVRLNCPVDVVECTRNFSVSTKRPSEFGAACCLRSHSEKCRSGCEEVMRLSVSDADKLDALVAKCGHPVPREPMWKCLMYNEGENARPIPPHVGPELQCCPKAISLNCRRLCKKLYERPWETSSKWQHFQQWCEYNSEEPDLGPCLQEVREPCKMGCSGLKFCTNFNHRPTENFRSCNSRAENVARVKISEWKRGTVILPIAEIPILDIETCQFEKWKALACSLEVKPCSTRLTGTRICHDDCIELLRECADYSRFKRGMTIELICDMFSPSNRQDDCISLEDYTTSSGRSQASKPFTQPCDPNPCAENKLCIVNRHKCTIRQRCSPYKCLSGCHVGDVGEAFVHVGQRVKIPDFTRGDGCYRACACTNTGRLQYCADLPCMDEAKTCMIAGQVKLHGSHFKMDCNFCSCDNGNVTCTKRQCLSSDHNNNRGFTGLPCNCNHHFLPVCAPNGQTYPSLCLARCMGQEETEIDFGACKAKDPCKSRPCKRNEVCVRASRVCVTSSFTSSCPQFECVAPHARCLERRETGIAYGSDGHHFVNHRILNSASKRNIVPALLRGYNVDWNKMDPVCDTNGVEHDNICLLRRRHRYAKLDYRGKCKKHCQKNNRNPVCGQNIVTYDNECAAMAERVLIDYQAACHTTSIRQNSGKKTHNCLGVECGKLSNSECEPITPPGACCPVCGGMLRILYSQVQVDDVARCSFHGPVTVRDILRSLRRHINVKECDIFGHLTIEADIAVLIIPTAAKPINLQVEACLQETERLARLINERNPVFHYDVILSTLTAAEVHGRKSSENGASSIRLKLTLSGFDTTLKSVYKLFGESFSLYDEDFPRETKAGWRWDSVPLLLPFIVAKFAYSVG